MYIPDVYQCVHNSLRKRLHKKLARWQSIYSTRNVCILSCIYESIQNSAKRLFWSWCRWFDLSFGRRSSSQSDI